MEPVEKIYQNGGPSSFPVATTFLKVKWAVCNSIMEGLKHRNKESRDISSRICLKDFILNRLAESGIDDETQEYFLALTEILSVFVGASVQIQSLKWL